jgi:hypothetical protein
MLPHLIAKPLTCINPPLGLRRVAATAVARLAIWRQGKQEAAPPQASMPMFELSQTAAVALP